MALDGAPEAQNAQQPAVQSQRRFPMRKEAMKATLELGRNLSLAVLISSIAPYLAYTSIFFLPVWAIVSIAVAAVVLSILWVLIAVAHFHSEAAFPTDTRLDKIKAAMIPGLLILCGLVATSCVIAAAKNSRFTEYCRAALSDPSDPYNKNEACRQIRDDETALKDRLLRAF